MITTGIVLSPPQRLLKNMKFEGIEIALEGTVSGMKNFNSLEFHIL